MNQSEKKAAQTAADYMQRAAFILNSLGVDVETVFDRVREINREIVLK